MAVLWMDGFTHYGGTKELLLDGLYAENGTIQTELSILQIRTGSHALRFKAGTVSQILRKVLPGSRATVGVGTAIYLPILPTEPNTNLVCQYLDAVNTPIVTFTIATTGAVEARLGSHTGTLLGSTEPILVADAYNHVEVEVFQSETVGTIKVRVNNILLLNLSGLNIGVLPIAQIGWGPRITGEAIVEQFIDDIFIWDDTGSINDTFLGDRQVHTLMPNGDLAAADWTKSTGGVGFSLIDDQPPDDGTFISAPNLNDISEFDLEDLPVEVTSVAAVMTLARLKKSDSGTAQVTVGLANIGAGDAAGVDRPITTVETYWIDVFDTNPNGGARFTPAEVDGAAIKLERTL